jgi:chaperonin GroES
MPEQLKVINDLVGFVEDESGPRNNIAHDFNDETLKDIGKTVSEEYALDKKSRQGWEERNKEIFELVEQMDVKADKKSAVKYPILATAALQFSARAYPNVVKGSDVVKCQVIGSDTDGKKAAKGKRVQQHQSYQVLEQMDSWEEEMDQLLFSLALVGTEFKKTYYNPVEEKNVSELVFAKDLVVNYYTPSLKKARRVTHVIELYRNDIIERMRNGSFLEFDFEKSSQDRKDKESDTDRSDPDLPYVFLEQHRYWDLDGDGYDEPYVITIDRDSQQVVRIIPRFDLNGIIVNESGEIARIIPVQYFTQFTFLPAFDGSFYKMGFGSLLFAPVNIVNTIFNQLLDAGTLANRQGGFLGPGVKLKKGGGHGKLVFQQGEWKQISYLGDDIRRNVFALPVREPSTVLFQLLGLMMEGIKELASQADVLTGEHPKGNVPATTTLALIEQGLKVFSAIYKRVYLSLKGEFGNLRRLNTLYLEDDEYNNIIDYTETVQVPDPETGQTVEVQQQVIASAKEDYSDIWMDIMPVSGAADVSDTQRTIKAQALLEMRGQGLNDDAINKRYLEALQIPDINEIMPEGGAQPPVDPKIEIEKGKLQLKQAELQLKQYELDFKERESDGKVLKMWYESILALAKAESEEAGPQLELYKQQVLGTQHRLNYLSTIETAKMKPQGGTKPEGG